MRTKALFSAAAAIAVGVATAQAQVYSVNIVGYVNQATTGGALHLIQNPLDDGTNTLNSVLGGAPQNSEAWVWNGAGYTFSKVGKTLEWGPDAGIPTGVGFFYRPAVNYTNTYVGEVVVGPGESATNSLSAGVLDLTGALLPYASAGIAADTNFALNNAPQNSELWKWNGAGYTFSKVGKTLEWGPDLTMEVGESFFLRTPADYDWVQTLPAN